MQYEGFIVSRHWRDTPKGIELRYWLATNQGPIHLVLEQQEAVFFLAQQEQQQAEALLQRFKSWRCGQPSLKNFSMQPVGAYYFKKQRDMRDAKDLLLGQGLQPLESDIKPSDRFLMERFIRGGIQVYSEQAVSQAPLYNPSIKSSNYRPNLKVISLDIETAMQGVTLYSIAVYADTPQGAYKKVFMLATESVGNDVDCFSHERELMRSFLDWLSEYDPDVIIGWNVINFDMWFLSKVCEKHRMPFALGREGEVPHWRLLDDECNRRALSVAGRVVIDGIALMRSATYSFESFSLSTVAKAVLGDDKLIQEAHRGEEITELFHHNKKTLAAYNLHDCKLVWDIFSQLKLMEFAIERTCLTGLPLDRIGGSVASFDFRYLPLLHRRGYVAPNGHWSKEAETSPGGFVMESKPGLYQHVLVLDFKSLYPSIIRSFKIDPLAMAIGLNEELDQQALVPGFKGAWFAKQHSILPELIEELWASRDRAKAENNQALSQAIKIIMSSFYGVLGSSGCRFFDTRLASSITKRGHQIIQQTAEYIEQQSREDQQLSVIYGDTDSVFVWLKNAADNQQAKRLGDELTVKLNRWWGARLQKEYGVNSALEIEFETHFEKFLMPTIRGSELGSKKRYAGVIDIKGEKKVVFKGLENVRTDWTPLARNLQEIVYTRVFFEQPYQKILKETVAKLYSGELDQQLIYRKRLRRKIDEYQRNVPPHVQAARKAIAAGANIHRGDWVEYVVTLNGSEPVNGQTSGIDYQHYLEKQLAPAVDSVLYFLGDSFDNVTSQQMSIF
ncbi:MAG: DNA polymerase-2 [Pseudohongiellaceae bacterium]